MRLTELGMAAQEYMKRGELVPDEPAPDEVAEAMAFRAADTPESVRVRL